MFMKSSTTHFCEKMKIEKNRKIDLIPMHHLNRILTWSTEPDVKQILRWQLLERRIQHSMADSRTLTKRDAKLRMLNVMIKKSREIMEDESISKDPQREVAALLKNIMYKKVMLDELNEDIVNTIEEEKIDEEIMRTSEFDVTIDTEVSFIESYLSTKCALSVSEDEDDKSEGSRKRRNKVNLPKLTIKKFNGDETAWVEFIDTYTVAIHDNEDLTAVEKFSYLKCRRRSRKMSRRVNIDCIKLQTWNGNFERKIWK